MPALVSGADVESFQRDGVACIRGAFDARTIAALRTATDETIAHPSPMHRIAKTPGESGQFFKDYHMARRLPAFEDFVRRSAVGEIVARLMRSTKSNFFYDVLWIKEPGTSKPSAWHQDQPYHTVDGRQICVAWTPLDPIGMDQAIRCIKGSHLWNRWFSPIWFENAYGGFDYDYAKVDARFEPAPDFDAEIAAGRHDLLAWAMEPGDCLVFHGLTVHGAPGNLRKDRRRRALSTTWLGDDAVYARRPGEVIIRSDQYGLTPGDSMECAQCPRIWPRESATWFPAERRGAASSRRP
jgi:ectoine hydroxylase-related dioxygenase (phytanoyl-CoA dioxygenase family)